MTNNPSRSPLFKEMLQEREKMLEEKRFGAAVTNHEKHGKPIPKEFKKRYEFYLKNKKGEEK